MLKAVLLFLIISSVVAYVVVIPAIVYVIVLVRTKKSKWSRSCSEPDDRECVEMNNEGMLWNDKYKAYKVPVYVRSGKYRLAGEYFDFGSDKAVIIVPGRMESCIYSYYYAEPYRKAGYNVLVIDNRAHGLSDGIVCSLGYGEDQDIIEWSRFLHDEHNCKSIILHGICIGSSTVLFALVNDNCPDYVRAMVADGMYINFYESFKNHMIKQKRPMFITLDVIMLLIRLFSKADVVNDGPVFRIDRLMKPVLFLHGRNDIYSSAEYAQVLYDKCTGPKEIVWFENGNHSRLRLNNQEKYDNAVSEFCKKIEQEEK